MDAHRLKREIYSNLMQESPALANLTACWQHCLLVQTSFSALSHSAFTIVERLARYILMVHDRCDGDDLPRVQEYFAWMLGVRRTGVTGARGSLKERAAVSCARGHVTFLHRAHLIEIAAGSYGPPEREYERTLGCMKEQS